MAVSPFTTPPAQRLRVPLSVLLVIAAVTFLAASAPTAATGTAVSSEPRLQLPAVTGRDHIGTVLLPLVDRARVDHAFGSGHRELIVQLWYPAAAGGAGYAPYMPRRTASYIERTYRLPVGTVSRIRTHARIAAPVAAGHHPVLLYSPGSSEMRSDATALVENLASEGFVVVAIDHTHESQLVEFPNGQLIRGTFVDTGPASNLGALRIRVTDSRFVIDQLAQLNRRGAFAGRLDLSRIGMFGFSLGGATAAATMLADPRVKAGADLDGSLYGPVIRAGLRRPFMLMLSPIPAAARKQCGARCQSLSEFHFFRPFYSRLRGARFAYELKGSAHESFDDYVWIKPQLATIAPATARQLNVGTISAHQAVTTVSAYLTAFFDRYLCGTPEPILHSNSPAYPDVRPLH